MLLSLDTSKASGPDNVSARILKSTAVFIAGSVTALFNSRLKHVKYQMNGKLRQLCRFLRENVAKQHPTSDQYHYFVF